MRKRKSFQNRLLAKKTADNECSTANYMLEGVEENKLGERNQVDGANLLDRCFSFSNP
jgi:hypothetical protein